ncbi:MAG: MFS transporter [Rubrivivax sp.]|nr:MFS transporter [Rubrivivax sp.]MCL4698623.1 MFS transporter [Burkholderiaceae bacterium]
MTTASPEPGPPPPQGFGRLVLALVVGQLGLHSTMAGVRMAASLQVLREGHGAWTVGLLLALFAAAPVLTAWQAGRLADRHGYHPMVRGAVVLAIAGALSALVSTFLDGAAHLALLAVAAMLCGTAANVGMLTIQRTAGLAARDSTERMRVFSWLGVAPSFANVIGPVAVGLMIDGFGFAAGYALMLALPLATALTARRVPRAVPAARSGTRVPGTAWSLLAAPGMRRLLVINWLFSMSWDVHAFAVPLLGHERGFNASTVGLILGLFTLSVSGIRLVIPLLAHRLREETVMRASMVGTALVFAAYPFAPNAWVMGLLAVTLGVTLGSVQPMIMTVLHHVTPGDRHGEALALRSMAMNATSTVMPLVFGASGALVGTAALFWAVAAAVAAGLRLPRRLAGPG